MIKGIIFDLGGTLLHFQGDWADIERQGAENVAAWYIRKKRIRLDGEAFAEAILSQRREGLARAVETSLEFRMSDGILQALQAVNAPKHAEPLAQEATRFFFEAEEALYQPLPDAIAILKTLHGRNLKLGLLSNASDDALIQRLVNRHGLRPWLSPVFSSARLGRKKPHAQPFLQIAERWRLSPDEIAMVGDTLATDILGAQNAGMRSVLITQASNPENRANPAHRHIKPEATIGRLAELPAAIAGF